MSDTYAQSFLIGAVLVLVYQAARFGELNLSDPLTGRYVAFLPGAKARDFAGPNAYNLALTAFLGASFVVYSLVCLVSPDVLDGATILFAGKSGLKETIKSVPYPLYVAAVFMGLTQPIFPGLSQFRDAQRTFFHNQIAVPRRVVDLSENLINAIDLRSGEDKRQLADEVRKLAGSAFLKGLQSYGDAVFYKAQVDKLGIGNGALETTIRASSAKELHLMIEQLVTYAVVAVMRRSGPRAIAELAKSLGAEVREERDGPLRDFLARLVAFGVPLCIGLLTIAFVLHWLEQPVNALVGKAAEYSLWPSTLDNVLAELAAIVPPIVICMILSIAMLVPRDTSERITEASSASDRMSLLNFFQGNAWVFGLCILIVIAIKVFQMFGEYGYNTAEGVSPSFLMLPVIQSFIAVALCLFTTWHLVSSTGSTTRQRGSILFTGLLVAGSTGFVALLYDLAFLDQFKYYLKAHPEVGSGFEHILFGVGANVLVSLCAFASVAVFFKTRSRQTVAG